MKLKLMFTINLFIAIFFGVSCSVFAGWAVQIYGLVPEAGTIWTTRLVGGSILGFASLMWYGKRAASVGTRRAIAYALLIQDTIGFVASMEIQLSGNLNAMGWSNPILYGLLAAGYAILLFVQPEVA